MQTDATERQLRVDLAACYRLVAHFGWDDIVFTHISARVPGLHSAVHAARPDARAWCSATTAS